MRCLDHVISSKQYNSGQGSYFCLFVCFVSLVSKCYFPCLHLSGCHLYVLLKTFLSTWSITPTGSNPQHHSWLFLSSSISKCNSLFFHLLLESYEFNILNLSLLKVTRNSRGANNNYSWYLSTYFPS